MIDPHLAWILTGWSVSLWQRSIFFGDSRYSKSPIPQSHSCLGNTSSSWQAFRKRRRRRGGERKKNLKWSTWISLNSTEGISQAKTDGVQGLAQRCISNVFAQLQMTNTQKQWDWKRRQGNIFFSYRELSRCLKKHLKSDTNRFHIENSSNSGGTFSTKAHRDISQSGIGIWSWDLDVLQVCA